MRILIHICRYREVYIGAAMGGTQGTSPPPRNRKKCCRKMVLFPKALFLATTFPKLLKNSIFLLNFYQNFLKISKQLVFFVQMREKVAGFVEFFWKYAKVMHFKQFFKEIFENFLKFSKNIFWKLLKMHYFSIFSKEFNKSCVTFSRVWTKILIIWKIWEKIENLW